MTMPNPETKTPRRILVTGSAGLIGRPLRKSLEKLGYTTGGLDIRAQGEDEGDVRTPADVKRAVHGCDGIIHLAAISRVIDGERNPEACWQTNVEGTRLVIQTAENSPTRPWIVYSSSREVYGQPDSLPADEDSSLAPVNIYGRSKVAAEEACSASSLNTAIVRFSNVYGDTADHVDRVVPAFARQAAEGVQLRVDGLDHTFDFTHVDDTVSGVTALVQALEAGRTVPPIHFVTGVPTTLGELARLAIELSGSNSSFIEAPPRSFDVSRFHGDPSRAGDLLGWHPRVALRDGLDRLISAFRARKTEVAS
jgi:nucleoside-diphosphate-sugar epimerase